ncbi:Inositol 2-dehydrogenase/D-chiro-inositol 3-dehydrogenase [Roseomonas sp. CECT 9278]|nr:Inositol 2-dehydrogenase/D-chiro-inositol 3-dehydrogenase [Roseomonas sp. CECT 9278]
MVGTPKPPIKIGILGASTIAREAMAPAFKRESRVNVVAIASRSARSAQALAHTLNVSRWGPGFDWILADPDIDAVYISLPPSLNAHWTLKSLQSNKHVLCEKPIALNVNDVARIRACARAVSRVVREVDMWRHHPQIRRLHDLWRRGALGQLRSIEAEFTFNLSEDDRFRWSRSLGGGVLNDLGPYCLGAVLEFCPGILDILEARFSWAGNGPNQVETAMEATLAAAGGITARIFCSFVDTPRQRLVLRGADDSVTLNQPWAVGIDSEQPLPVHLVRGARTERFGEFDPYLMMLGDFAERINGGDLGSFALERCERRVALAAELQLCARRSQGAT